MVLEEKYRITEIKATWIQNAPYRLTLRDPEEPLAEGEEESTVTLDAQTANKFDIPLSLGLVNNKATVCLVSKRSARDMMGPNDLVIRSLKKEEVTTLPFTYRPHQLVETRRVVELRTPQGGGTLSLVPCPLYRFKIRLTEEEYEAFKNLPPRTVFELTALKIMP